MPGVLLLVLLWIYVYYSFLHQLSSAHRAKCNIKVSFRHTVVWINHNSGDFVPCIHHNLCICQIRFICTLLNGNISAEYSVIIVILAKFTHFNYFLINLGSQSPKFVTSIISGSFSVTHQRSIFFKQTPHTGFEPASLLQPTVFKTAPSPPGHTA